MKYLVRIYRKEGVSKRCLDAIEIDADREMVDGEDIGDQIEKVIVADIESLHPVDPNSTTTKKGEPRP